MKLAIVLVIAFAVAAIASTTENKKQIKLPHQLSEPEFAEEHAEHVQMQRRGGKGGDKFGKGGGPPPFVGGWGPPPMPMGWGWGGQGGGYGGGFGGGFGGPGFGGGFGR